jgi:hypothetical protein
LAPADIPPPADPRPRPTRQAWLWAFAALWLGGVVCGLFVVSAYENAPGANAAAPRQWPAGTTLVAATDRATLVFVAHPQCTCTSASLDELTQVLARAPQTAKTYVLFLRPTVFDRGWAESDLWRRAAALPAVIVVRDDDGAEARRFGVETSGQTLLYDRAGMLVYSGGITGARGHAGDNAGEAALLALLTRGESDRRAASVFGCPLFERGN